MASININTNVASYNGRGGTEYIYSKAMESTKGQQPTSNSIKVDIAKNKRQGPVSLLNLTRQKQPF